MHKKMGSEGRGYATVTAEARDTRIRESATWKDPIEKASKILNETIHRRHLWKVVVWYIRFQQEKLKDVKSEVDTNPTMVCAAAVCLISRQYHKPIDTSEVLKRMGLEDQRGLEMLVLLFSRLLAAAAVNTKDDVWYQSALTRSQEIEKDYNMHPPQTTTAPAPPQKLERRTIPEPAPAQETDETKPSESIPAR